MPDGQAVVFSGIVDRDTELIRHQRRVERRPLGDPDQLLRQVAVVPAS